MIKFPQRVPEQSDDANDLLGSLLTTTLPVEHVRKRPAQLRSTADQQRIALRPFLLRTWFDYALHHIERVLFIGVVIVFSYWFVDGYGRDWWHVYHQPTAAVVLPNEQLSGGAVRLADVVAAGTMSAEALPFTTQAMEQNAAVDYLVPQPLAQVATTADPRPQYLRIASINLETPVKEVVVQDSVWQVADYAAGYHHGSALPGHKGNVVMAGHAGLRGAVFQNLGNLAIGDAIVVETGDWTYTYHVRELQRVWPTQVDVMHQTNTPVLTLITCTSWDTQRLIVVADLVDARPLT